MLMVTGCPGPAKKPSPPVTPPVAPPKEGGEFWNYKLFFPDQPPHLWEADVVHGQVDPKTGTTYMHKLTCRMYRQGQVMMRATTNEGKVVRQGKIAASRCSAM